jgi:Ino eighty subunit 1
MRAQLRTYHAIPCLQAHQDPIAYKQLQDAPRLKSILKGASEDAGPNSLDRIKSLRIPRTNPVNLIFVLSQYAPKISELHFFPPRDFFDLVMRGTLSSKSRAKAFLWLIWFYLESDFSGEAAKDNPFGPGQVGEGTGGLPLKVPVFEHLSETQAEAENEDTEAEMAYGERKRLERRRILEEDATVGPPLKKAKKGKSDRDGPFLCLSKALLTKGQARMRSTTSSCQTKTVLGRLRPPQWTTRTHSMWDLGPLPEG